MRKSVVHQKRIVLILATILLLFSIQDMSYSQQVYIEGIDLSEVIGIEPRLSVDQIYDKTIRSLVWIQSEKREGSGVLIDEELRLAVTNHHVTRDDDLIMVYFPVRDRHGALIDDRDFYIDKSNLGVLTKLGYAVGGRIVAKSPKTDLVIVQLDGLPDTAREIEKNFSYPIHLYMDNNDRVQIFGNPGGLKLWKWAAGFFQTVNQEEMIQINAGVYRGNSGGPVLDDQGVLIGIATLSNERTDTWAVPARHIKDLLDALEPRQVFSIQNNAAFTVYYQIKWREDDTWTSTAVKPDYAMNHWYSGLLRDISQGYPKIRFDYIANDGMFTPRSYQLQTYTRSLGSGVELSRTKDAREYHFSYNSWTKILDLRDSEKSD